MSRSMGRVVGFGALSVDEILHVNAPLEAGKGRVVRRTQAFGGNVATALVAVARLGGNASYIGWLSSHADDPATHDLLASNVDIGCAPRCSESRPIRSIICVGSDGERFIAYDDDVVMGTDLEALEVALDGAGALLVDGYATQAPGAVRRARSLGIPIVADVEWTAGDATVELIEQSDHLVLPLAFARAYSKCDEPNDILGRLWSTDRSAVVLTDGSNGVFFRESAAGPSWHLPAHDVSAVDTTGAGDCFHGAYAQALVSGAGVPECVKFASATAAISVTGRGGRDALPDSEQVIAMLRGRRAPTLTCLLND